MSAAPAVAGNTGALDKAAGAGAPVAIDSGIHKAELGKVGAAVESGAVDKAAGNTALDAANLSAIDKVRIVALLLLSKGQHLGNIYFNVLLAVCGQ